MTNKSFPRRLQAVLLPDGSLQLEADSKCAKQTKSSKVIADDTLSDLFGLDMNDLVPVKPAKKRQKKTQKQKPAPKKNLQGSQSPSLWLRINNYIDTNKNGLSIKDLQKSTGFPAKKLYGILFRLNSRGKWRILHKVYKKILSKQS